MHIYILMLNCFRIEIIKLQLLTTIFNDYQTLVYFFCIAAVLSIIMFSIAFLLSLSNLKDNEKLGEYECGFEPFDNATRRPFDVHFYVVGILFLIFDVEIAILFP
jgi:NADH-quinone oxidoreductase subunit A